MRHALPLHASLVAAALCGAACDRVAWSTHDRADARVLQVPAPIAPVVTAAPPPTAPPPTAAPLPATAPAAGPVVALNAVDVPGDVVIDAAYGETSAIAFASDLGADRGAQAVAAAPRAPAPSVVVLPLPTPVLVGSPSPVPAPTTPGALPWGGLPRDPPAPPVTAGSTPGAAPGTAGTSVAPSTPPIPFGMPAPPTTPGITAGDPGMLRGTGS